MTKRKSGRDFRRMAIRTTLLITVVNIAASFLGIDCGIILMPATILAVLLGIFVIASAAMEKIRAMLHRRLAYQTTRP